GKLSGQGHDELHHFLGHDRSLIPKEDPLRPAFGQLLPFAKGRYESKTDIYEWLLMAESRHS
ncbi:hypothetical protein ACW9H6_28735, partial [Pseudomonas sp. SDO528_S397]